MTTDRTPVRFPALTAVATLAGLLLFLVVCMWMYVELRPQEQADAAAEPYTKRSDVEARNLAVLDGKEPGTRPMADALPEFIAKQKAGTITFPVPPAKK